MIKPIYSHQTRVIPGVKKYRLQVTFLFPSGMKKAHLDLNKFALQTNCPMESSTGSVPRHIFCAYPAHSRRMLAHPSSHLGGAALGPMPAPASSLNPPAPRRKQNRSPCQVGWPTRWLDGSATAWRTKSRRASRGQGAGSDLCTRGICKEALLHRIIEDHTI